MRSRHVPVWVVALIAGAALVSPMGAQTPDSLKDVLTRAGEYVEQYQSDLTSIVAEERYVQDVRTSFGNNRTSTRSANIATHVELLSDLIFIRTNGAERWMQYRDVFEVDGKPVRDRTERLMTLFADPAQTDQRQVEIIIQESARYNIGPARRTLNMPMLALVFLAPEQRSHVKFAKVSPGNVERFKDMAETADIWAIEYREDKGGTMIRGAYDRDMPSHGRFWVDSKSGAVLRSEMIAEDPTVSDRIEVTYVYDRELQLLVPADMRETLTIRLDNTRVEGRAAYSRFRKFQVQTDEAIAAPIQ